MRPFAVGLGVFVVFAVSPVKVQSDSIWSIPTAVSILDEGNTDLDEYLPTVREKNFGTIEVGGHVYNGFPLGPSLAAVPLLFVFDTFVKAMAPIPVFAAAKDRWRTKFHATGLVDLVFFDTVELLIASLFVSGAAVFVYLTGRRLASERSALIVTAIFAFGTSAYSTASRVLWQHAPSILVVAAIVWLLSGRPETRGRLALVGGLAALAFVFRPTNALTVVACALCVRPRQLGWLALGTAVVALPFVAHTWSIFGAVLPPYYLPTRLEPGEGHFFEALAGNLVSPGRGLFVYSPVLLGCFLARPKGIAWVFAGVVAAHWVVISAFPHWWAGHSYGPRLFTDVLPYATYFLFQVRWRAWLTVAAVLSVLIHFRGSTARATHAWNDGPPNVDVAPERVWDWRDPPFLR